MDYRCNRIEILRYPPSRTHILKTECSNSNAETHLTFQPFQRSGHLIYPFATRHYTNGQNGTHPCWSRYARCTSNSDHQVTESEPAA